MRLHRSGVMRCIDDSVNRVLYLMECTYSREMSTQFVPLNWSFFLASHLDGEGGIPVHQLGTLRDHIRREARARVVSQCQYEPMIHPWKSETLAKADRSLEGASCSVGSWWKLAWALSYLERRQPRPTPTKFPCHESPQIYRTISVCVSRFTMMNKMTNED